MHELLVERLHVAEVVVGENFTFGKKAAGNVQMLKKAGSASASRLTPSPWSQSTP